MKRLYNPNKLNLLKYKFKDVESIERNYSQAYQDIFVLTMLNGKKNGIYLEIGANDAIDNNNTLLLEQKFNWIGISVDIDESSKLSFEKNNRKSKFLLSDALKINYEKYLNEIAIENRIDYLQLDIEPQKNTFDCLKIIPFDKFKFSVITFETDVYIGSVELRDESRKYIESMGYVKVVGNICPNNDIWPFEDWYVDPQVVDPKIVDLFKQKEDFNNIAEKFMLNI
jgi:hypothetical protein